MFYIINLLKFKLMLSKDTKINSFCTKCYYHFSAIINELWSLILTVELVMMISLGFLMILFGILFPFISCDYGQPLYDWFVVAGIIKFLFGTIACCLTKKILKKEAEDFQIMKNCIPLCILIDFIVYFAGFITMMEILATRDCIIKNPTRVYIIIALMSVFTLKILIILILILRNYCKPDVLISQQSDSSEIAVE